jgi:hypothetical protein
VYLHVRSPFLREWKKLSMGALSWLLSFRLFKKKAVCDILFTPLKNFHNPSLNYTPLPPKIIRTRFEGEMTRIIQIVIAIGLPTSERKS